MARALLLWIVGAVLAAPSGADALVLRIVQPAPEAVVDAAAVPVALAVDGADLSAGATTWPHAGAFHLALDGADVLQTTALQFTLMAVPPGPHRLRATLEGYAPTPIRSAEVALTAQSVPAGPGASWFLAGTVAIAGAIMVAALVGLWLFWVRPQRVEVVRAPPPDDAPEDPPTAP